MATAPQAAVSPTPAADVGLDVFPRLQGETGLHTTAQRCSLPDISHSGELCGNLERTNSNSMAGAGRQPSAVPESSGNDVKLRSRVSTDMAPAPDTSYQGGSRTSRWRQCHCTAGRVADAVSSFKSSVWKFCSFIGPGFMISVAYIDPGNFATDIGAGALYRYSLLFVVLVANMIAVFLQSLAIKLGTVSGLNLAEACRAYLPWWLNYFIYGLAEVAVIATDIAEVIGFAIALNLLAPAVPLVAGCAISILDVMIVLLFYKPNGPPKFLRPFELFIVCLVLAVMACFCIELSLIKSATAGEVFRGYLPSSVIFEQNGIYQACGIVGATVMPHSLYLGSGLVQSRLRAFDKKQGLGPAASIVRSESSSTNDTLAETQYLPSIDAVRHALNVSIVEVALVLSTFALFINSAILIIAGACLYENSDAYTADIFGVYVLISQTISPKAGTVFALALLLSGLSAGIICTTAGQMVSEGALNWTIRPWLRRLITRTISITPSIIIAGVVGRAGLNTALVASQVILSVILPFVAAPLIFFTCLDRYMTVRAASRRSESAVAVSDPGRPLGHPSHLSTILRRCLTTGRRLEDGSVRMGNSWLTMTVAVAIWLLLTVMNVANLVLLVKGV